MKRKLLLALLLACGTAQASDWVSVGKTANGQQENFVDISSIRVTGSIRRAWAKGVQAPHTERGTDDNANKWVSYYLSRETFNCREQVWRSEALTIYYDDETNGSMPAAIYPQAWEPVPPDTTLSALMQFICAWKPK
jgi:hypothetical protein